ncbi:MAG: hypothetical protein M1820_008063 [Bogoriella megaspora]|nr:MAG: hypothetical protein M1820_008063 [Bogoriella megaspora]
MERGRSYSTAQSPASQSSNPTSSEHLSSSQYLSVPSTAPRLRSTSPASPIQDFDLDQDPFDFSALGLDDLSLPVPFSSEPSPSNYEEHEDLALETRSTASSKPSSSKASETGTTRSAALAEGSEEFDTPPRRVYKKPNFDPMPNPKKMSQAEKEQLITSLRTRRINTLLELRRVEKLFAQIGTPDLTEPMTIAWQYYVNSNQLLNELRSLTKNYPFSSSCLDDAKQRVYSDPNSNRSWNYCWLVLIKIHNDGLVRAHAEAQAALPAMWGNRRPEPEEVARLANAFTTEWSWALGQMLRNWDVPPTT